MKMYINCTSISIANKLLKMIVTNTNIRFRLYLCIAYILFEFVLCNGYNKKRV